MGVITVAVQGAIYGRLAFAALKSREALVSNLAAMVWIGRAAGWLLVLIASYTLVQAIEQVW